MWLVVGERGDGGRSEGGKRLADDRVGTGEADILSVVDVES